jgi:hypothetical protein
MYSFSDLSYQDVEPPLYPLLVRMYAVFLIYVARILNLDYRFIWSGHVLYIFVGNSFPSALLN